MEIERKFLVAEIPAELEDYPHELLSQGYLISAGEDLEVRLRASGGSNLLTIKQGRGLLRAEHESVLEPAAFARLWPLTEGRRIEKCRYRLPAEDQDLMIELDAYAGALDGLLTAEVEFADSAQAHRFKPPAWFGAEITDDPRFSNQCLAETGLPPDPVHEGGYELAPNEPLGAGLTRLIGEQVRLASEELAKGLGEPAKGDSAKSVHEARKCFKRVRAALKLARAELDADTYKRELAGFRDLGRGLASTRDGQVLIETLDGVCKRQPRELPAARFAKLRAALVAELRAAEPSAGPRNQATASIIEQLASAGRRLGSRQFRHDEITALGGGLERIYRRGRRALRAAATQPSDERLHDLRKRSQELWHAAQILGRISPGPMSKLARRAHSLSDLTGKDHDLAVLATTVSQRPDCFCDRAEQAALLELIGRRRAKLQLRALRLAGRLYRSKPRRLRALVEQPRR